MSYAVIASVALIVSALTLFSGFGLGTLLMPGFALFFPVPVAVAATAVVHGLNNLFKLGLLYRHAVPRLLVSFGLPAAVAAFPGAWLLGVLSTARPWMVWELNGRPAEITPVKLVMGLLILVFAAVELLPVKRLELSGGSWLPLGGIVSGFFGGLSGHQGALRAVFLGPLRLTPAQFAGTQAAIACLVDAARLTVYGGIFFTSAGSGISGSKQWSLVAVGTASAFAGAYLSRRMLSKVTVGFVRRLTGILLVIVGAGLACGLL